MMQLLEGQTLREWIESGAQGSTFSRLDKLLDFAIQIADGLEVAHQKGIIHRDIKPANIFITSRGQGKILDFGVAKFVNIVTEFPHGAAADDGAEGFDEQKRIIAFPDSNLTRTSLSMGTPSYLSPEQVRHEKLDTRTDLFSFGLVLYEMATGERAFPGNTATAIRDAVENLAALPARQLNSELPADLERIITKALEKERERRYQHASEMGAELRRLKQNTESSKQVLADSAVKLTAPAASPPQTRGNSVLLGLQRQKWGVVASLVLVSLIFAFVLYTRHNSSSTDVSGPRTAHRQVTFLGNAYDSAISPDGMFVAYVTRKFGEDQNLMVQAPNGSSLELAHGEELKHPRWSPDGSELVFTKFEPAAGLINIFLVSRLGGVARPIGRGAYACWSPDGAQIITSTERDKAILLVNKLTGEVKRVSVPGFTRLYGIDSSTKAGLILAHTRAGDKHQIWTFRPDGAEQRKVVEDNNEIYSALWSPRGDSIYYLRATGNTSELARISVAGISTEAAVIASGLQAGSFFSISADGSRLAYTRVEHASNLWMVHLAAGRKAGKPEMSRLTSSTSYYGDPSFSPDGRWITFPLGSSSEDTNIYKMQIPGGQPVQLTFFEHVATTSPAWSPDAQRIAFISNQKGTSKVWTVNANGGATEPMEGTNASDTNHFLAWFPSQDIVYQKPGVRNFLRVNNLTREEKPIIRDDSAGWVFHKPIFSFDGRKIAVVWNRGNQRGLGLWVISLEPYSERLVLAGEMYPFGWSLDGNYIYAIRGREIIRVGVATPNQAFSVVDLPGFSTTNLIDGLQSYASLSHDGLEIIANVGEEKSDVWLMENFDPTVDRTRNQPSSPSWIAKSQ